MLSETSRPGSAADNGLSAADFDALVARGYTHVPLIRRRPAGPHTPLSLYRHLARAPACLLQSSRRDGEDGRWSILVTDPVAIIRAREGVCELDGQPCEGPPVSALAARLARRRGAAVPGAPPFAGGAVGFVGYECNRFFEPVSPAGRDELKLPDFCFLVADDLWVFDHATDELLLISSGDDYAACSERLDAMQARLAGDPGEPALPQATGSVPQWQSNFTEAGYSAAIRRIQDYIRAGDTFQVNLSQRLSLPLRQDPLAVYQRLVAINPVHFSGFADFGDFQIISGSPERLVRVRDGQVCTRPIAGTRRRGSPEEEARFVEELRSSEKERAEHVMLVDLERNDLGRICRTGSVRVSRLMEIIKYSHVMHIESLIEGELRAGAGLAEVLRAMFPGGTITGAPKVRTMEIIAELEPDVRGAYTGTLGYVADSGALDFNILIRTIVARDGQAHVQAGGGIVHDADPRQEYRETLHKARAQLEALA